MKKLFSFFVIALMAIGVNAANGDKGTTATGGPYKVGDYYNDGTKEGIVFEVYDGGWHGKIVSLDESEEQWAVDAVFKNATGATSKGGGMGNMNKIKKQPNWKSNYPAFAWCASLGNGWYLPAVDELMLIYENKSTLLSVKFVLHQTQYFLSHQKTISLFSPYYQSNYFIQNSQIPTKSGQHIFIPYIFCSFECHRQDILIQTDFLHCFRKSDFFKKL